MDNASFVSVVVCTKNRKEHLEKLLLPSIFNLDYSKYEIIFVDDASDDDTSSYLASYAKSNVMMKVFRNNISKGLCHARNIGIRYSKGEIIAFTDDDCILDRYWLKELAGSFLSDREIGCIGGKCYLGMTNKVINPSPQIHGCNMAFRANVLKRYLFDANLKYFHWHDEKELLFRMANNDVKIGYNDRAVVRHFFVDADHRKYGAWGWSLNKIYKYAKTFTLFEYYKILFKYWVLKKKIGHEISEHFDEVHEYFRDDERYDIGYRGRLPFTLYILLFEIPFNSRIARLSERNRLKKQRE